MKAVQVTLLTPRAPGSSRPPREDVGYGGRSEGGRYGDAPRYEQREFRAHRTPRTDVDPQQLDRTRRRLERLVSLLVDKGVIAPGELDGIDAASLD